MPLDGNVPGILSVHAAHQWGQIAIDGQHLSLDVHQLSDNRVICSVEFVEDALEAL